MLFVSVQAKLNYLEDTLNNCILSICEYFQSFWKNSFKTLYFGNQRYFAKILC